MSTKTVHGLKYTDGIFNSVEDVLTAEELLSISINGKPYTITMRTPGNEKELVRGILFTEQIYCNQEVEPEIQITGFSEAGYINSVNVIADEKYILKDYNNTRNLTSVSSCGICGKVELDLELKGATLNSGEIIEARVVSKMFEVMSASQNTFISSGGSHASAAFTLKGEMIDVKEDIGRHNAMDKVIGSLVMNGKLKMAKCIIVSGRISYEIVSKTYAAGIPFLASVSAPSTMAVDYCNTKGITLMAFCRNNKLTVYANTSFVKAGY